MSKIDHEPEQRFMDLQPAGPPPALDRAQIFAEDAAPSRSGARWRVGLALGFAAAAGLAVAVGLSEQPAGDPAADPDEALAFRGQGDPHTPELELRLYLSGEPPQKLGQAPQLETGDEILFEVASDHATRVYLWVEGPEGGALGHVDADAAPRMLTAPNGLMAWEFSLPGAYTIYASDRDGECAPPGCDARELVVADP